MIFYPDPNSLKLISTAEDFVIKVWDLVLKKEVACLKPKGKDDNMAHMTTSIIITNDRKFLMSAGLDGCIHFWNLESYKLVSSVKIESIGGIKGEEITCMNYLIHISEDPCLLIGGSSGFIYVYSIKR
jgi:WD40 repeat protein